MLRSVNPDINLEATKKIWRVPPKGCERLEESIDVLAATCETIVLMAGSSLAEGGESTGVLSKILTSTLSNDMTHKTQCCGLRPEIVRFYQSIPFHGNFIRK